MGVHIKRTINSGCIQPFKNLKFCLKSFKDVDYSLTHGGSLFHNELPLYKILLLYIPLGHPGIYKSIFSALLVSYPCISTYMVTSLLR